MTTNETYDLDAEILLAANPYRIPTDADLVEAERGCNQYKHKPGCPEAGGSGGAATPIYYNNDGKTKSWKDASYVSFQKVCTDEDFDACSEQLKKEAIKFADEHADEVVADIFAPKSTKLGDNKYGVEVKVWKHTPYNAAGTHKEAIEKKRGIYGSQRLS